MANDQSTTNEYTYTVVFEPAEEGGYTATCPALPGLVTEGDTLDEARAMATNAMVGYLESLQKDGLPIPPSAERMAEPIQAALMITFERV